MARRKKEKFRQIGERSNVIQPNIRLAVPSIVQHEASQPSEEPAFFPTLAADSQTNWPGRWRADYFGNNHPIVVELGCGRGEYSVGLAGVFPEKNFIGVDRKGDRLWKGSGDALQNGLSNVAFIRLPIQWLEAVFAPGELNEIWLTFPDPRPRDRDEKHRLTHPAFLALYRNLLAPGGTVHLKTDSELLFTYTLDVLQQQPIKDLFFTDDLYASAWNDLHHGIQTHYEAIFTAQGFRIKYLQFKFEE